MWNLEMDNQKEENELMVPLLSVNIYLYFITFL